MNNIKTIIDRLQLIPHIEGGYYKRIYQSNINIHLDNTKIRPINTSIYYLLESHDFSCWHRLKSDELWHYYCGSDLIIYQIDNTGNLFSTVIGNPLENPEAQPMCIVPANTWFAAKVISSESFALVGCIVSPGFEYEDFEMGKRADLLGEYPQYKEIIIQLTR